MDLKKFKINFASLPMKKVLFFKEGGKNPERLLYDLDYHSSKLSSIYKQNFNGKILSKSIFTSRIFIFILFYKENI